MNTSDRAIYQNIVRYIITMPPSSRKRNKGKERKAKQKAKKEETNRLDAHHFWQKFCSSNTGCNHGCDLAISDHPVSNFMDQYFINTLKQDTVEQNLLELFKSHTQIWKNESYRKSIIDILVCMGTNMVLKGHDINWSVYLAQTIALLEQYYEVDDINAVMNSRAVMVKSRDIWSGSTSEKRDALKFFRKRTSCKCLKKMHLEERKSTPKVGNCSGCKQEMERVLLSICSRCMLEQYCSKECQVAHWSVHESRCDIYVRAHQQYSSDNE